MEVCSTSSCYLVKYTAGVLLYPGDFWKITIHFLLRLAFPSWWVNCFKAFFCYPTFRNAASKYFLYQLKIQFLHPRLVWKFLFFTLKCFMLPSENQKCSMPVSGWLDLNFLVSLHQISLKWPEFLLFFFWIEFNIKVHFSVWCSGFGTAKWFTTSENYNMGKMLKTKNLDLKLKIQLSWKKWRISSFHPKILLEIGQHILNF